VILEEGMSQEAVLAKLVRKAGYRKQCQIPELGVYETAHFFGKW
jgi:AMMECR1 domain-containing protein